MTKALNVGLLAGLALAALATSANAQLIRPVGYNANSLAANDDGSTGFINFGLGTLNFFGQNITGGWVNNNGNVTLNTAGNGPLSTFTPFNILTTGRAMLAPFFADVDTRNPNSGLTTYGNSTVGGRNAFFANWENVGYFSSQAGVTNSFQLVVIERSDRGAGDFDFCFFYDRILWETGQASGGNAQGLGGNSARAGWSNGSTNAFELAGSAVNGAFLDNGPNSLAALGGVCFVVRNGQVEPPTPVIPLPPAAMAGASTMLGLAGLTAFRRRRA
jgi:hypothetical protein